ncbi:MAG: TolC family protein, partial [Pseudomonadota bacterium]|nr:TolC family protein [Pseudomonadota bacterium]
MKRCPYSLLLMLFTASVDADTLTTVIQQTLTTKPEVLMSINSQRAAAQELKQAQAGYLPSIDLTAGYGRENSENITTRSRYPEGDVSLNRQELSLTLSQMLFDGFKVSNQVKRQESLVDSSSYQVDTTKEETTLQTVEAYLEILRYQKLVELAKNNVVVHQKMLARIQTLVEGGAGRQADIQQSQSRLALAKSTLIHMEGLKRNAETEYLRVTGQAPRALTYPDTELQLVKRALTDYQLTETMPPEVIETLFNTALMHHPNLEAAQAELKAAQAQHQQ